MVIASSVGSNGVNNTKDVRIVQRLLNDHLHRNNNILLSVDGIAGPKTKSAIEQYQRQANLRIVDGRIDPNGATIKKLVADFIKSLSGQPVTIPEIRGHIPINEDSGNVDFSLIEKYLQQLGE